MNLLIKNLINSETENLFKIKTYKRRQTIFHQYDSCDEICIVLKGAVKIRNFFFPGEELVDKVITTNEIFSNDLIFSSRPFYKSDVIAVADSTIAFLDKNNLINLLQNNQNFLTNFLKISSDSSLELNSNNKMFLYESAEKRFLYYLLSHNNRIQFKSIQSLADKIGLQRETLSRLISKLEKDGLLQRIPHEIYLLKINHQEDL